MKRIVTAVRPKKFLGQHFLMDEDVAKRIADTLDHRCSSVVEVGPGMGVLTKYLLEEKYNLFAVEVDDESIYYLKENYPQLKGQLIKHDFLTMDFNLFPAVIAVTGNFPYNISSQILFKILEHRDQVSVITGMFQKEVAARVVSPPGNRDYGILSVLMQVWYDGEYLFTVDADKFHPPPKVQSGVIRFIRNERKEMQCNEVLFKRIVKQAFNQRRKTLRNSLRSATRNSTLIPYADKRPEQLTWKQFEEIVLYIEKGSESV